MSEGLLFQVWEMRAIAPLAPDVKGGANSETRLSMGATSPIE